MGYSAPRIYYLQTDSTFKNKNGQHFNDENGKQMTELDYEHMYLGLGVSKGKLPDYWYGEKTFFKDKSWNRATNESFIGWQQYNQRWESRSA